VYSVLTGVFLLLLLPVPSIPVAKAQDAPAAEQSHSEFFSGVVTSLSDDKITVFKTVLGKNSETRTFLITPDTRVEGKLRLKARVTVRYAREEEGERALHIIVRNSSQKK
jgi:hypothetical protein